MRNSTFARGSSLTAAAFLFGLFSGCGGGGGGGGSGGSAPEVERYALVTSYNGDTLVSYAVESESGYMRVVDRESSLTQAADTEINPVNGDVLVVTEPGLLRQYSLNSRGKFRFEYGESAEGSDVRDLAIHPSGDYVYLADFTDGTINQFVYDEFDQVTAMAEPSVEPSYLGANFTALAVQRSGGHVYAADFSQDEIARFSVGEDGSLTYVDSIDAGNGPWQLTMHPSQEVLYVSNRLDGTVSIYTIAGDGSLSSAGPAQVMGMASSSLESVEIEPDGEYLYTSDNSNDRIWQFSIGETGLLSPLSTASISVDGDVSLRKLSASPVARRIYLMDGSSLDDTGSRMLAFDIAENGQLSSSEPEQVVADQFPTSLVFVTGEALEAHVELAYVVNAGDEDISQFTLNDAGEMTEFDSDSKPTTDTYPAAAAADPTGRFVYVANYTDDTVSQFKRSTSLASLDELTPVTTPIASDLGPASVAVHPSGRYLYVVCRDNVSVSRYDISNTGVLSGRTDHSVGFVNPVDIAVDPQGRYIWVVTDSGSDNARVVPMAINPANGELTLLGGGVRAAGSNAKSVDVSPDGKTLYVASAGASQVWIYSVAADGTPSKEDDISADSGPVTVLVSPDGSSVYSVNTVASNVSQFDVDSAVSLAALDPVSVSTGTAPVAMAMAPTGSQALVTNSAASSVTRFSVGEDGALVAEETVSVGVNPQAVVVIGYTE